MVSEKTIPNHELKYYHSDDLGFVFIGAMPSSDEAIQRLVNFLVEVGVSKELPMFYVRTNPNIVAFVYDGNSGFKSGPFYRASQRINLMGLFKIEALGVYLDGL